MMCLTTLGQGIVSISWSCLDYFDFVTHEKTKKGIDKVQKIDKYTENFIF